MRHSRLLLLTPALLALVACGSPDTPATATTGSVEVDPHAGHDVAAVDHAPLAEAVALLEPTEDSTTSGELHFSSHHGQISVTGTVTGLTPGAEHGFHVHEFGDCSAPDGSSAGGHFDPFDVDHGRVGEPPHHVGDSDNIVANAEGVATFENVLIGGTIGDGGEADIVGKGVIVHAGADDYETQPTGDAGGRLACAVVALVE